MRLQYGLTTACLLGLFVAAVSPSDAPAQNIKSGVVNSRDRILNPTTNQQQQAQQQNNQTSPPVGKGEEGPLPCNSQINPKCDPVSPSKPEDPPGKGG